MKERLLQVVSIGLIVMLLGTAWAESDFGEHRGMHRGYGGMMHGGRDMNRLVEHMSRRLELDDAQELAIRNIVDAVKSDVEALDQQAQSFREAMRALDVADAEYDVKLQELARRNGELVEKVTLLHGRVMAEVSAELTDEQRVKISKGRDGMRRRFEHRRRSHELEDDTTT